MLFKFSQSTSVRKIIRLSDDDKKLFNDMINTSDEFSACTSVEHFKMGFALSVRMMIDYFKADEQATLIDI